MSIPRENVAFTQLGRGGDVVDIGRGCGGLQPNILLQMKEFSLYFHYCEHRHSLQEYSLPDQFRTKKHVFRSQKSRSDAAIDLYDS